MPKTVFYLLKGDYTCMFMIFSNGWQQPLHLKDCAGVILRSSDLSSLVSSVTQNHRLGQPEVVGIYREVDSNHGLVVF